MRPSKFQETDSKSTMIPLRVSKDSRAIQKPSLSCQQVVESLGCNAQPTKSQARRQPVIIYTHSPKVIHANARDFMSLVQRLTGISKPKDDGKGSKSEPREGEESSFSDRVRLTSVVGTYEDNESSSHLTEERYGMETKHDSSVISPMYGMPNPYPGDVRDLFAQTSNESFVYNSTGESSVFQSQSTANSCVSTPSFRNFMKSFQEY